MIFPRNKILRSIKSIDLGEFYNSTGILGAGTLRRMRGQTTARKGGGWWKKVREVSEVKRGEAAEQAGRAADVEIGIHVGGGGNGGRGCAAGIA